jgi:hypothetical protein
MDLVLHKAAELAAPSCLGSRRVSANYLLNGRLDPVQGSWIADKRRWRSL